MTEIIHCVLVISHRRFLNSVSAGISIQVQNSSNHLQMCVCSLSDFKIFHPVLQTDQQIVSITSVFVCFNCNWTGLNDLNRIFKKCSIHINTPKIHTCIFISPLAVNYSTANIANEMASDTWMMCKSTHRTRANRSRISKASFSHNTTCLSLWLFVSGLKQNNIKTRNIQYIHTCATMYIDWILCRTASYRHMPCIPSPFIYSCFLYLFVSKL